MAYHPATAREADDELFSGHTICAYIDANGEIDEPVLEG
jgi:hypothetical protein